MDKVTASDVLNLPIAERIQWVEDVWDSIAEVPEAVELTDWQRDELDRRLRAYHKNPDCGSPWEEVKSRILQS